MRRTLKYSVLIACCAALARAAPAAGDRLLRRALAWAGELATGAAVDVGSARIHPLGGRLELRSVAVADKRRPWRNLFQFDHAVLEFSPKALLRGCVLIREAGVDGLVAGGVRSTSGALRGGAPSPFEMMLEEQLTPAGLSRGSTRALDRLESRLADIPADLPRRPPFSALAAEAQRLRQEASLLRGTALVSRQGLVKRAELEARVRAAQDDLDKAQAGLDERFEAARRDIAEAEDAREQAVEARLGRAGAPEPEPEGLDRRLFGPAAAEVLVTGLSWVKALQPDDRDRTAGRPALIVETTRLSGKIAGAVSGEDMNLEGMILGASSDPRLYGKPTRLIFKGETPGGASVLGLQGTLQQLAAPGSTELAFHYSGMSLAGAPLGDDDLGAVIERGKGRVNGTLRIEGDRWTGNFSFEGEDLRLSPRASAAGPARAKVAALLRSTRRFKVEVLVDGNGDDLRVGLKSSLGPALAAALASAAARWRDERRKAERAEGRSAARLAADRARLERLRVELYAPLRRQRAELSAALRRTAGQAIEASFPE